MVKQFKASEEDFAFFRFALEQERVDRDDEEFEQQQSKVSDFLQKLAPNAFPDIQRGIRQTEDVPKAGIRGLIKGFGEVGRLAGPLDPFTGEEQEQIQQIPQNLEDIIPVEPSGPTRAIERAGELLPLVVAGGGEKSLADSLIRSLLAGTGKEAAGELGLGETGEFLAEAGALGGPNIARPRLQPTKSQREFVAFARRQGLTEEQIAPLLRKEGRIRDTLTTLTPRGGTASRAVQASREGLDKAFEGLRNHPDASLKLNQDQFNRFITDIKTKFRRVPDEVRKKILQDIVDFGNSDLSLDELANLWSDINSQFDAPGGKRLQTLKDAFKIIEEVSPEFAKDFKLTNDLATRFHGLRKLLEPGFHTQAIKLGEVSSIVASIASGNIPAMTAAFGFTATRRLARELLINPRLQNLTQKMGTAIKNNAPALLKSLFNSYKIELGRSNVGDDVMDQIQELDPEEFLKLIEINERLKKEK